MFTNITNKVVSQVLFLLITCCSSNAVNGQKQQDAVAWVMVNIEKKITNRFSLGLMTQTAFNQNFREMGAAYLDLGVTYKLSKHISVAGNYRFTEIRNLDNFYQPSQRVYADVTLSKGYKKFYFQFRSRIQMQYYGIDPTDSYRASKYMNRNRFSIKYNINRVYSPYIFLEQFYRLNNAHNTESIRAGIGLTYKFNLQHRIDFYFLNQFQMNRNTSRIDYIYGATYSYKF
jgi:hypothetical protein